MGKKPRKTKELSVAIAEASSRGEEEEQQQKSQSLPQTPRKRGRPRKVVEMKEQLGEEEEEEKAEDIEHGVADDDSKSQLKRIKTKEPEKQQSSERGERIGIPMAKEEGSSASAGGEGKQPSRSKARRKSKPRKSS